jgi:hypothetical protein
MISIPRNTDLTGNAMTVLPSNVKVERVTTETPLISIPGNTVTTGNTVFLIERVSPTNPTTHGEDVVCKGRKGNCGKSDFTVFHALRRYRPSRTAF